ncbi:MAG: hypothetical protein CVT48_05100 [Thermoplasmata archaeon HGW-Thermoplasmata-1]|nr:MAG: hypothetical protein CVT48_05100 [Thermoplasmata archaeon HGW-Thermoplasmata-1]
MLILHIVLIVAAGGLLAFSIGGNDIANAMGTSIGSGAIKPKKAFILASVFLLIGALALGGAVRSAVGGNLVESEYGHVGAIIAMFSASSVVLFMTKRGLPTSTTQALIGGLVGWGIAAGAKLNWAYLGKIAVSWLVSPLIGFAISACVYLLIRKVFVSRITDVAARDRLEMRFRVPLLVSSCAVALAMGANEVSQVAGFISFLGVPSIPVAGGLGIESLAAAAFMTLGIFTFGSRVSTTVGRRITDLVHTSSFAAQFATAAVILAFSQLGIPVSTTHTVVGAVIGVGMVRGEGNVDKRSLREIGMCWLTTFPSGFAIAFLMTLLYNLIF